MKKGLQMTPCLLKKIRLSKKKPKRTRIMKNYWAESQKTEKDAEVKINRAKGEQ